MVASGGGYSDSSDYSGDDGYYDSYDDGYYSTYDAPIVMLPLATEEAMVATAGAASAAEITFGGIVAAEGAALLTPAAPIAAVAIVATAAGAITAAGLAYFASSGDGGRTGDDLSSEKHNVQKIDDKYLKRKGVDAHELKRDVLGRKVKISEYDLYVKKDTGEIFIYRKGGKGEGIPTGEYIK